MFAERHTIQLPSAPLTPPILHLGAKKEESPLQIAQQYITKLEAILSSNDVSALPSVMHADSWWRDMLTFSWDMRTIHGLDNISNYFTANLAPTAPYNLRLRETGKFAPGISSPIKGLEWLESMFDFETKVGRGSGMIRLVQGSDGVWKGYMMYTALQELKGFEEGKGDKRPHGSKEFDVEQGNWQERRDKEKEFVDSEPDVFVVGAGERKKPGYDSQKLY